MAMTTTKILAALFLATAVAGIGSSGKIVLADEDKHELEEHEKFYVQGWPAVPSEAWAIAMGARIYDNWINALEKDGPKNTHSAWPASNTKKKGKTTWRCKSCHGWDMLGRDGKYGSGSYKTGIKGVQDVAGMDENKIHKIIMDEPHNFTHEMIPEPYMKWLATFLSKGQYDIKKFVSDDGDVSGDPNRGKAIFQNICASCHGYNGTALNWGEDDDPNYVGTEANANPWEVFFKIRHGHPGVEMVALTAFSLEEAANVLSYAKTLPKK